MRLDFPSAYPPTTKNRYEPSTAIAQFSTGRKHVLGLADDGKVWQWNTNQARLIKPLHVDVGEKRVSRVVAGMPTYEATNVRLLMKPNDRVGSSLNVRP